MKGFSGSPPTTQAAALENTHRGLLAGRAVNAGTDGSALWACLGQRHGRDSPERV